MNRNVGILTVSVSFLLVFLTLFGTATAQETPGVVQLPGVNIDLGKTGSPEQISVLLQIMLLLTILSLAPAIMIMMTSFTRLIVVFGFLRQAMGTQQMPPGQVLSSLAIFLTIYIMAPVWTEVNDKALQPYLSEQISGEVALERAQVPIRAFMFKQTRESDIALMVNITGGERPKNKEEVSTIAIIPAYMISELKTAFQIGFLLYVPFLIIDMVVASVLLSMGMMMLPPIMVSLPFKLMLFVLIDGWALLVGSMVRSFG
jgi:flagellar biosynthetic protein FliP